MNVKICGVRSVAEAEAAHAAGADWIGLNFVPGRARAISLQTARELQAALPSARFVGVLADPTAELIDAVCTLSLAALQLHGDEPPSLLTTLIERGVDAYKAIGVRSPNDLHHAGHFPGARVLFDAAVGAASGGLGVRFDWSWLAHVPTSRPYWLAGGLTPDNVAHAILAGHAAGVDVASGVESNGRKDPSAMRAFVAHARAAFTQRAQSGAHPPTTPRPT